MFLVLFLKRTIHVRRVLASFGVKIKLLRILLVQLVDRDREAVVSHWQTADWWLCIGLGVILLSIYHIGIASNRVDKQIIAVFTANRYRWAS
jgi:hypothetical protein